MLKMIVFHLMFFLTLFCFAQEKIPKEERTYNIFKVDSTENYYIAQATVCTDSVVLVIDKKSKQLKEKKIKELGIYKFKTYRFFDSVYPSAIYCHEVDHIEIWCSSDNKGLHFTDGMGNEYMEDEIKKRK